MDPSYELLERVTELLRAEERRVGSAEGLQPVHLHVLGYLDRCNRYSDNPAAVAEYLDATKGTVSQSLKLLQARGLVRSEPDAADRRRTHLALTPTGRRVVRRCRPPGLYRSARKALGARSGALTAELERLLRALQRAHGGRAFGVCATCRHFRPGAGGGGAAQCGLTLEPLGVRDAEKICREHE